MSFLLFRSNDSIQKHITTEYKECRNCRRANWAPLKYPLGVHLEQNVHIVKTIEARIKRTFVCLSISMIFFLSFLHHQGVFSLEINLDFKSEHWLPPYAIWISIEHSCGEYALKQKKCSNEFVHLIWVKVSNCNCIGAFNISKNET